jgi:DNA mismatch repair protein MutS2
VSAAGSFDLDPETRRVLELDAVLDYASSFASSAPGAARILALAPSADAPALEADHAAVEEAAQHIERGGRLLPARLPDPGPGLEPLRREGMQVDPLPLRELAVVLLEAADARRRLAALQEDGFPALRALGREIPDLAALARPVVSHVAPDGRLEDGASPELGRIRQAIARVGERLRRQLESFLHDPSSATVVRDDFVTQRNGRFVIPVRADAPKAVDGIVHAASSSGQTLFVEPIASVALNNDLVRLAEEEAAERDRVVRGWAERFRGRLPEVEAAVFGIAELDGLQARALFGREIEGVRPRVAAGAPVDLRRARHPLLDRRLKQHGARCVPISIAIDPYDRVLLISGPNTGGKTVALKTVGLTILMAQSGLPVAAEAATIPVFGQMRADIGDHQSIDADLSTFSAHVRAVTRALSEGRTPALFLFDEIGTGTEPGEGAALAQAILERLLATGITTIATTHHAALKGWAFSEERVLSAAMEFDPETLRPTYRVLPGAAGASAGIEVAFRLGLDPAIVARARGLSGESAGTSERMMTRLRELTSEMSRRAESLRERESALETEQRRVEAEARDESQRRREEAARALETALREFRRQSQQELLTIADARERARSERAHAKAEGRLRETLRARTAPSVPLAPFTPVPGARVRIVSYDREGEIVGVRGETIDVRMGSATFSVKRADLAPAEPAGAPPAPAAGGKLAALLAGRTRASLPERSRAETPQELHLLGRTVDEALPEVDRFLDASSLEGRTEVRIVHGHGTGRLRVAVRGHLKGHPQVEAFRPGAPNEGGDGATVVTLR